MLNYCETSVLLQLKSSFKSKPPLFRPLSVPLPLIFLSHSSPILSQWKQRNPERKNDKEKKENRAKQGEREGRRLQASNKFWSKFRSGSSGYEVCFKQKSSLPSSLMPQFSLPLRLLSSFPVPHASIFFSHLLQPQPHLSISLKATGSSLCFALFASYTPLSHSALTCLFRSPAPPSPRPFASSLPATDERRNKWRSAC